MNTAPRSPSTQGHQPARHEVRAAMEATAAEGVTTWTICARHDVSGEIVGYTELALSPHTPWKAAQGDTGVHPDHRERGLGRWLKAHNAVRLLDERPEVGFIETWNASANAPMLAINRAMGFETVARRQEWVLDL